MSLSGSPAPLRFRPECGGAILPTPCGTSTRCLTVNIRHAQILSKAISGRHAPAEALLRRVAVASIWEACTATSTKATYWAAEPLNEEACKVAKCLPWLPPRHSLEVFAGYLPVSAAFAAPTMYWWAVVEAARGRGFHFSLDKKWADEVATRLERGLPPHEQAAPLTVPVLRQLGVAATKEMYFLLVLSRIGALFSVAQTDCFLHLCRMCRMWAWSGFVV